MGEVGVAPLNVKSDVDIRCCGVCECWELPLKDFEENWIGDKDDVGMVRHLVPLSFLEKIPIEEVVYLQPCRLFFTAVKILSCPAVSSGV